MPGALEGRHDTSLKRWSQIFKVCPAPPPTKYEQLVFAFFLFAFDRKTIGINVRFFKKERLRLKVKHFKFALPDQKWTIAFLRTVVSCFFLFLWKAGRGESIILYFWQTKKHRQIQNLSKGDFKARKYLRLASGAKMHILATFSENTFYLLYILTLFWEEPTVANGLGE